MRFGLTLGVSTFLQDKYSQFYISLHYPGFLQLTAWAGAGNDHSDWRWLLLALSARAGWLGVKHQFTYLLTCSVCRPREQVQQGAQLGAHVPPDQRGTLQGAVGHEDAVPWRLRQTVPAHPQGAVHVGSPVRVISLVEYLGRDVGWAQRPKSGSTPSPPPPSQQFFSLFFSFFFFFWGGGGGGDCSVEE